MQTTRIVQAVVLIMIVATAASCAASKEYTSKLFTPRVPVEKDSQVVALRFLELDNLEPDQENWVTTDIIMGRDTSSKTLALDKLSTIYPANSTARSKDSTVKPEPVNITPVLVQTKPVQVETRSQKYEPLPAEVKPEQAEAAPVARALNPGEVRNKRSRE
ncbi:MAG: hypothetical protein ABIR30_12905 [Chitinophagaceae bacterium]